ncbi:MAG TPA: beta-ketoacyl-ACP synthase 3 [Solirubrobacteraceae bacterium]|nr:beta-ketoacyl-ACP synthase 3 [Solirubrobacteraceae bacterium]
MRPGAAIAGVAMALPERLVSNDELAAGLGVDPAWITKRTGTRERPWASGEERLSQLAAQAGRDALERAGLEAGELDLVLVATSTADEISPNAAPLVAGLIGAERAGALDVGAACTGWLSALAMASGQIESGRASHALVVGADFLSRFLDVADRDTAPLFADGAGAVVVSATESPDGRIGPVVLHADHSGAHLISLRRGDHIRMDGQESFRAAVASMARVTVEALEAAGCGLEDVDLFVYHQANSRIIRAVGQRLDLPAERVVDYVGRFANSSTATLPIALSVAVSEGRLAPGHRVLLAAFGAGLTWGGAVVEWSAPAPVPTTAADGHNGASQA